MAYKQDCLEDTTYINLYMKEKLLMPSGVYTPNMLVDGEFQIWEEGDERTSIHNQTSYLSTMWSVSDSATVKAKRNGKKGIKIIAYTGEPPCHVQYLFEDDFLQDNEKYTLSCVINGKKYVLPIVAGKSVNNDRLGYTAGRRVYVRLNVNDVCDYVKLEQGELDTGLIHENSQKALRDTLYYFENMNPSIYMGHLLWGNMQRNTIILNAPMRSRKRVVPTLKGEWNSWTFRSLKSSQVTNGRYNIEDYAIQANLNEIFIRESYTTSLPESEGEVFDFTIIGGGSYNLTIDARIY